MEEISWQVLVLLAVGGLVAIWFLETLIDIFVTSRIMSDPVNGKILATLIAYAIASVLHMLNTNSAAGFLYYLPGALIIGALEYRKGLKIRKKVDEEDVSTEFE